MHAISFIFLNYIEIMEVGQNVNSKIDFALVLPISGLGLWKVD